MQARRFGDVECHDAAGGQVCVGKVQGVGRVARVGEVARLDCEEGAGAEGGGGVEGYAAVGVGFPGALDEAGLVVGDEGGEEAGEEAGDVEDFLRVDARAEGVLVLGRGELAVVQELDAVAAPLARQVKARGAEDHPHHADAVLGDAPPLDASALPKYPFGGYVQCMF